MLAGSILCSGPYVARQAIKKFCGCNHLHLRIAEPGARDKPKLRIGFVMFLMMAEVLSLSRVAKVRPDSALWQFLAHHQSHVAWIGCSLHDLIQPSFSFLVGVALPFSLASRAARGQSRARMI